MYRTIAEDLRDQIESGELGPGQQLKTELELREQYTASRNTVRDAIKWLTHYGLVETRPGQGTFVTRKLTPFTTVLSANPKIDSIELEVYLSKMHGQDRRLEVTEPRVEIQRARGELATQLGVNDGEPVISRHQHLSIDAVPWYRQATYYPMEFVNRGALQLIENMNLDQGAAAYLKKAIGITQASWSDVITARAAETAEITFFGLPATRQVPVIEIQRIAYDETGNPMRLIITVFPADRNNLRYE